MPIFLRFENLSVSDKGIISGTLHMGGSAESPNRTVTLLGMCYGIRTGDNTDSPPTLCDAQHLGLSR